MKREREEKRGEQKIGEVKGLRCIIKQRGRAMKRYRREV